MHFDIFTLFPTMFQGPFTESILKRAQERGLLSIALHDIRAATTDKHHIVDDYPYGGGAGMVMKPEPIFAAIEAVYQGGPIIYLTPQGRLFNQQIAQELAQEPRITLLCGHYEGIDERVCQHLVTDEISIGDYVLTGGELAAMIVVDAVSRLMPGVLSEGSPEEESHSNNLLEYPQYTRPPEFRGWRVPDVLLSGHHENVARWRRKEAIRRTQQRRPDLFARLDLSSKKDKKILQELLQEAQQNDIVSSSNNKNNGNSHLSGKVNMQINTYQNVDDFLSKTRDILLQHEVANNLMLGLSLNLQRSPRPGTTPPYLATVEDEQGLIIAALMTPPHNLVLYSNRPDQQEALTLLITHAREHHWPIPGAIGPAQVADDFVKLWEEITGQTCQVGLCQRVFELTHVIPPRPVPGHLRLATEADLELLTRWINAFQQEALHKDDISGAEQAAMHRVGARAIYVWEGDEGKFVSMAMKSRAVVSTVSISFVYTPPEYRGMGYASNCVAALSQRLLDEGWRSCCLFTDLANPTSNSIYQKMGYRPVCDFNEYRFAIQNHT